MKLDELMKVIRDKMDTWKTSETTKLNHCYIIVNRILRTGFPGASTLVSSEFHVQ